MCVVCVLMNDDVQMKKKRKSLSDFTPNCSSKRAPLFLFFFALGETFFLFQGLYKKRLITKSSPQRQTTKQRREKKVNTEEEEEFERTRKNKYKRENDDQRFYHLVLAECEIDDGFFIVKKVVFFV